MPKDVEKKADEASKNEEKIDDISERTKNTSWEYLNGFLMALNELPQEEFSGELEKKAREELEREIKQLLDNMKSHYLRRNSMGNYIPMTVNEYQDLRAQFIDCERSCRNLPENLRNNKAVKDLHTALLRGVTSMASLPENNLPPLEESLRGMMPSTIRLTNESSNNLEGGMSSRMPITYTDELGNVRNGILTKEDHVAQSGEDEVKRIRAEIAKKYNCPIDVLTMAIADQKYMQMLRNMNSIGLQEYVNKAPWFAELDPDYNKRVEIYVKMSLELMEVLRRTGVFEVSGIEAGSKIARRNGAMTDVAKRLGFSNLLVESRRVTIEQDGKKVDGIIMEPADMNAEDKYELHKNSPLAKIKSEDFENEKVLRSLADLQIIDYICGNTDRHKGNFFTKFDTSDPKHPKIVGVQGIDNDNSFGTIKDGGVMRLAKADVLKIITPEMADAVEKLEADDLDEILKDYDLSEKEIDAAHTRLDTLKRYIENGRKPEYEKLQFDENHNINFVPGVIHIVKPDEWENSLTIDKLAPDIKMQSENIFFQVGKLIEDMSHASPDKEDYKPIEYTKQDPFETLGEIRKAINAEYDTICKLEEKLKKEGKEAKGGTTEFKDMADAVHELAKKYKKVLEETKNLRTLDDDTMRKLDDFYKDLDNRRDILSHYADVYQKKSIIRFTSKGRARNSVAGELKKIVAQKSTAARKLYENGKIEINKEIKEELAKNAYEISANVANRIGNAMEKTMRTNVEKHAHNSEEYALGIKALEAQKRLWKFGQSEIYVHSKEEPEQKTTNEISDNNIKEKISINELSKPDRSQAKDISEDVNTILAYIDKQKSTENGKSSVRQRFKIKKFDSKSMTPKEAKSFLGMVFEHESSLVNAGKTVSKSKSSKAKAK